VAGAAIVVVAAVMAPALIGLYVAGRALAAARAFAAVACAALGAYDVSNQNHILEVAPGRTDISSACASASFNAGIAEGSLFGGLVFNSYGLRTTALLGGPVAVAGLFLAGAATRRRRGAAPPA
jgi:DHA1 family inner membrane transport protein